MATGSGPEVAVPFYNQPLVICTRNKALDTALTDTDITTCLEHCVLHFAIVPQLAFYRDGKRVSYISPYFRGGNLKNAKALSWRDRLRILYHISCAIDYLHKPPCDGRTPVAHGGISRKNIVLDEQNNARLLYYGPNDIGEAYRTGDIERDKAKDWEDFKQVFQEMFPENDRSPIMIDKLKILEPDRNIKAELTFSVCAIYARCNV
ncbi:LRSK7-like protein [Mya arenaria]|uniref:LRSK7-like protein n=1 Tax=Mya arenaria TaxID=6604 RepID=A0ABY7G522_MYAAR|nr:LRSK7-like protein [Mya arenaria]